MRSSRAPGRGLQEAIAAAGALDMLLGLCKSQDSDSDVIESATAAIANLTAMWEPNCVAIARAGGVEVLTGRADRMQSKSLSMGDSSHQHHVFSVSGRSADLESDRQPSGPGPGGGDTGKRCRGAGKHHKGWSHNRLHTQCRTVRTGSPRCMRYLPQLSEHKDLANIIHAMGIQPFVIMCGSRNVQVTLPSIGLLTAHVCPRLPLDSITAQITLYHIIAWSCR